MESIQIFQPVSPLPSENIGAPDLPEYALEVTGDCLSPFVKDGDCLIIENRLPSTFELGAIYFKDGRLPLVKIVTSQIPCWPVYGDGVDLALYCRQINPFHSLRIPYSEIAAIHTVRGLYDPETETIAPVNPATFETQLEKVA